MGCSVTGYAISSSYLAVRPTGVIALAQSQQRSRFSPRVIGRHHDQGAAASHPEPSRIRTSCDFRSWAQRHRWVRAWAVPCADERRSCQGIGEAGTCGHGCRVLHPRLRSSHSSWASTDHSSASWQPIRSAGGFSVNAVAQGQGALARQFAARGGDKFEGLSFSPAPRTGRPC